MSSSPHLSDTVDVAPTAVRPTAGLVSIGDELLSGRTLNTNAHSLAARLEARGISLREVRTVPDEAALIAEAVNTLRTRYDIAFTCGGIGPTHDDITVDAIASAFDVAVVEDQDALKALEDHYAARGEEVTDARRRMARVPDGARLIRNEVSGAPGIALENVYILAGVPAIFESMLDALEEELPRGQVYHAYTVVGAGRESLIADGLGALESALHGVSIGSYPGKSGKGEALCVVCKAFDDALAHKASDAVVGLFKAQGVDATLHQGVQVGADL